MTPRRSKPATNQRADTADEKSAFARHSATLSLIAPDQGECPLGRPCYLVVGERVGYLRRCDGEDAFVGDACLWDGLTKAAVDEAVVKGASAHVTYRAYMMIAERGGMWR